MFSLSYSSSKLEGWEECGAQSCAALNREPHYTKRASMEFSCKTVSHGDVHVNWSLNLSVHRIRGVTNNNFKFESTVQEPIGTSVLQGRN
jgi:hypothetical protein